MGFAVLNGHLGTLKKLYEAGASLLGQNLYGSNLLHRAIICESRGTGSEEMIKWLIEKSVPPDQKDDNGLMPEDLLEEDSSLRAFLKAARLALEEKRALEGVTLKDKESLALLGGCLESAESKPGVTKNKTHRL